MSLLWTNFCTLNLKIFYFKLAITFAPSNVVRYVIVMTKRLFYTLSRF